MSIGFGGYAVRPAACDEFHKRAARQPQARPQAAPGDQGPGPVAYAKRLVMALEFWAVAARIRARGEKAAAAYQRPTCWVAL